MISKAALRCSATVTEVLCRSQLYTRRAGTRRTPVIAIALPCTARLRLLMGLLFWILARPPRYAAGVGGGDKVQQDEATGGGHDHQGPEDDVHC